MDMFQLLRPHRATRATAASEPVDPMDRWDWSSTVLVILALALVVALTFDLWTPMLGLH